MKMTSAILKAATLTHKNRHLFGSKLDILSIVQFLETRQSNDPKHLFENGSLDILQFGCHPLRFRHEVYVYFKYGYWHSNRYGHHFLLSFLDKIDQHSQQAAITLQNNPQDKEAIDTLNLISDYRRELSITMIPVTTYKSDLCQKYLEQLFIFLKQSDHLDEHAVATIILNIQRIVFPLQKQWQFISERQYGLILLNDFELFIDKLGPSIQDLSRHHKETIIAVGKSLKSQSIPLLQFVKNEILKKKKEISLNYTLLSLNLLAINRTFPYEYFYQNKGELLHLIESSYDLSEKKIKSCLSLLELFSRLKLFYCQKILSSLLKCISQNIEASDPNQLVRLLFFYSRVKCSIDHEYVVKCVERISMFLWQFTERDYGLIIKAVAGLNYRDQRFVQKLKRVDYELFLVNLKYDCRDVGSYYRGVLEEVEKQYQGRVQNAEKREQNDEKGDSRTIFL